MKLTLVLLIFFPLSLLAQDYIVMENGVQFNCKITSVTKDEVTIIRDSVTKKIPYYLVKKMEFNSQLSAENIPSRDTLTRIPMLFKEEKDESVKIPTPELDAARGWNTAAIVCGGVAIGFALYNSSLSMPQVPTVDFNNPSKYASEYQKFANEARDYADKKDFSEKMVYVSATTSLLFALISYGKVIQIYEARKNTLSFKSVGSGFSISYRF